jgi:hypothetical protein
MCQASAQLDLAPIHERGFRSILTPLITSKPKGLYNGKCAEVNVARKNHVQRTICACEILVIVFRYKELCTTMYISV